MAASGQLLGLAGRVLAVLLVLSACGGADTTTAGTEANAVPLAGRMVPSQGPVVVDTVGAPLTDEHAEVVRSVHRALQAGDLDALSALYAGDDWAAQAALLAQDAVRRSVLDGLRTHPDNLGEGYLYSHQDYQTAFFLDYDPPRTSGGPLRWRGIAPLAVAPADTGR